MDRVLWYYTFMVFFGCISLESTACMEVQIKIGVKYSKGVLSGSGTHPQETHEHFDLL
jgi:hypothetical protein